MAAARASRAKESPIGSSRLGFRWFHLAEERARLCACTPSRGPHWPRVRARPGALSLCVFTWGLSSMYLGDVSLKCLGTRVCKWGSEQRSTRVCVCQCVLRLSLAGVSVGGPCLCVSLESELHPEISAGSVAMDPHPTPGRTGADSHVLYSPPATAGWGRSSLTGWGSWGKNWTRPNPRGLWHCGSRLLTSLVPV